MRQGDINEDAWLKRIEANYRHDSLPTGLSADNCQRQLAKAEEYAEKYVNIRKKRVSMPGGDTDKSETS
jgi:hypothetical protein